MKRKNATRNALVTSIISLLLCVSMLVGTTFAWFTDEVVSGNNVIAAGNLDVELYNSIGINENKKVTNTTPLFEEIKLWEPGVVAYENLTVANVGTLALQYQLTMNITGENTVAGTNYKLSDVLKIAVVEGGIEGATREAVLQEVAESGASWETLKSKALSGQLTADTADTVGLVIYWQPTANDNNWNLNNGKTTSNGAKTLQITLGINLFATQLQHEKDSFDETYDKDAALEIPEIKVETPTADAFLAALKAGETAVLTADLALDDGDFVIPAGTTSAIDLNDHTLTVGANGGIGVEGNLIVTGTGNINVTSGEDGTYAGFQVDEGATMEIGEGVSINTPNDTIGIIVYDTLIVDGATINVEAGGHGIFTMQGGDVDVIINSGAVDGEGSAIYIGYKTDINIVIGEDAQVGEIVGGYGSTTATITYYGDTAPNVAKDAAQTITVRKGTAYEGITQNPDNAKQYYIESKAGLMNLNALLADVKPNEANIITVDLTTDVNLAGENWSPINSMWVTFNGNDHTIKNVNAGMSADGRRSGFWGYAGAVTINDLTLENVTVSGSQAGTFAGSAEGLKVNNCFLKGNNTVNFVAGVETWNGIGAITGVLTDSDVNVEIVAGATVTLNKGTMTTDPDCTYVDDLTGYIQANNGTVTNNGTVKVNVVTSEVKTLDEVLKSGGDVVLNDDVQFNASETTASSGYGATGVSVKGGTLDGNGNSLGIDNWGTWDAAVHTTGGTIKNLTVNSGMRGIFMGSATADVYIDNVIIDGTIYTFNSDGGSKDYGVYISNSTLNGWTSHSDVHKEVVYTNCNFGEGNGYAFCRPYGPTTFKNCVFEEGFEFDTSKTSAITFENCYYGDTLITVTNAASLASGEVVFFYKGVNGITINGSEMVSNVVDLKAANGGSIGLDGTIDLGGTQGNYLTLTEDTTITGGTIKGTGWTGEINYAVNATSGNIVFDGVTFDTTDWSTVGWAKWGISVNVSGTANVTFRNCTFKGTQCPIYLSGANAVVTLETCTFESTVGMIQCEIYSGDFSLGQDLIVKNCDFTGMADVLHIYDYDKDPSSEAIAQYLTDNSNIFTGVCKQTCN